MQLEDVFHTKLSVAPAVGVQSIVTEPVCNLNAPREPMVSLVDGELVPIPTLPLESSVMLFVALVGWVTLMVRSVDII